MEDMLEGGDVNFVLRTKRNDNGTTVPWADKSCDDYTFRPTELESMCFYEMIMIHKKQSKTRSQIRREDDENNIRDEEI